MVFCQELGGVKRLLTNVNKKMVFFIEGFPYEEEKKTLSFKEK